MDKRLLGSRQNIQNLKLGVKGMGAMGAGWGQAIVKEKVKG
jgi:hypothetical protein